MHVALIGMGHVGQAQARLFAKHDLVTYDPAFNSTYPTQDLKECEFAVISVGTPANPDGSCDTSSVFAAYNKLPAKLPVIIRSTVPPGTTHRLMRFREAHTAFVPEFIQERRGASWVDSSDVPFLLLGAPPSARDFFRPRLAEVFPGRIHICSALEAELAKYASNIFNAMKVTFTNEMAQICGIFGANWEEVREALLRDKRMTPEYTEYRGFQPGYGGPCLPKDVLALVAASRENGYDPEFFQAIHDANERFRPFGTLLGDEDGYHR